MAVLPQVAILSNSKELPVHTDLASRVQIVQGDITRLPVAAIVNAANESLLGGGGVDGAIHRAAGPELLAECEKLGGCPTGQVRMTSGYCLPAQKVLHAVGPVYRGGRQGEAELLRSCYVGALQLCAEHKLESVAFPCISTGVYCYPKAEACQIATAAVANWLAKHGFPKTAVFCCFSKQDAELYLNQWRACLASMALRN